MKYRPIREYLADSMADAVELQDIKALRFYLDLKPEDKLEFKYQGYDKRCGWMSFLVVVNGEARGHTNDDN